jgi:hypothetical protein
LVVLLLLFRRLRLSWLERSLENAGI